MKKFTLKFKRPLKVRVESLVGEPCLVCFETYSWGSEGAWSEKFPNKRKAMKSIKAFLGDMKPVALDRDGEWYVGLKLREGRVQLYAGLFPNKRITN